MKSQGYGTRAAAEGTKLAARYDHFKKKADRLNKGLKTERLQRAIREFHESIHVEEVNRQLNGIKPSKVIAPPTIEYELTERARVAQLFSQAADVTSREALYPLRIKLVRTLAQLCKRRESPCRRQKRSRMANTSKASTQTGSPSSVPRGASETCDEKITKPAVQVTPDRPLLFCPFCRWADDEIGEGQRRKTWRIDSLARHLRTQHLTRRRTSFVCPYNGCLEVLMDAGHFANHTECQHRLHLPPALLPR
jgi:hypothetical protein